MEHLGDFQEISREHYLMKTPPKKSIKEYLTRLEDCMMYDLRRP